MGLTIGSLFSGIGGLELGLERSGLGATVWQVEKDAFCQKILAKHCPNVERFEDVQTVKNLPRVDLICGGFPCQDVSSAGKRAGLAGARSGLWRDFARIVGQVKPRFVVVENVASGKRRYLPTVRRDLHVLGYDTTAYEFTASEIGAPFRRGRVFVVANADSYRQSPVAINAQVALSSEHYDVGHWRTAQPPMVRMVPGVSGGLDRCRRIKALGNAVVPQCAEVIGRMLQSWIQ